MATFEKRGDLQWRVKIRRRGFPLQTRTFNTKAEAEAWARSIETEMDRGSFVDRSEAENTTLSEALDRYAREISPHKKGSYQELCRIENLKTHSLGKRFIAQIRGSDIALYRDERLKMVAAATVRLELAIISHLFEIARKEWGMESLNNPVRIVNLPKKSESRDRRLLLGEEEKILEFCEIYGGDLPHIVRLALETGMRRGEIVGMTWEHVNLKKNTVLIPKTKNGEKRTVPLSKKAVEILKGLSRRIGGRVWEITEEHSVTTAFRRAISRARSTYEKECQEKRIKPDPSFLLNLTFHDLRHEATSRFFEKGLNPMQVAAITGHKTLQMLRRYTHLRAEDLAKMLDR
ncbi:MAG: putative phage integrase [Leptospirillum rubarum]|nr:MAG: putative phage integrase [Leptospirillum rubarum]